MYGEVSADAEVAGAEYSRLQADAENARRSQQRLYEIANSPSGNPPRPILTQEFTTKTVISPGPMEKVRAIVLQLAWHFQVPLVYGAWSSHDCGFTPQDL